MDDDGYLNDDHYFSVLYPHNDGDCHGTRCPRCECCIHSKECKTWPYPCADPNCGCFYQEDFRND